MNSCKCFHLPLVAAAVVVVAAGVLLVLDMVHVLFLSAFRTLNGF